MKTISVLVKNKHENAEVVYSNVANIDRWGAIWNGEFPESVYQLIFPDGTKATFKKSNWDLVILK